MTSFLMVNVNGKLQSGLKHVDVHTMKINDIRFKLVQTPRYHSSEGYFSYRWHSGNVLERHIWTYGWYEHHSVQTSLDGFEQQAEARTYNIPCQGSHLTEAPLEFWCQRWKWESRLSLWGVRREYSEFVTLSLNDIRGMRQTLRAISCPAKM